MTYRTTYASREEAREAGRLCCCVCLLDLGDADDPYRDPDCPRCLERELAGDDSPPAEGLGNLERMDP